MRRMLLALIALCALSPAFACSKSGPDATPERTPSARAMDTTAKAATTGSAAFVGTNAGTVAVNDMPTASVLSEPKVTTPAAELGKPLYQRYCQLCHGEEAKGYAADNAPSLVTRSFLESATDEFIARGIAMGRPQTAMAAYARDRGGPLTESQIAAIVAYVRSLGPAVAPRLKQVTLDGDPALGKPVYEAQCQVCHGTATTRGNALSLHNPELLASATPSFLHHAIVNGRENTPMPAFRNTLSERQIMDVVAYLQSFAPKQAAAPVRTQISNNSPVLIHPKGSAPKFTLREGRFVSSAQVNDALRQGKRMVIVDARSPADWIQVRIPGSVPIAYYDTEGLARIPNDGTWVIAYCACPHHASGAVIDALKKRGYKNTAVLDEGILFWQQQGYPVEGEATSKGQAETHRSGTL